METIPLCWRACLEGAAFWRAVAVAPAAPFHSSHPPGLPTNQSNAHPPAIDTLHPLPAVTLLLLGLFGFSNSLSLFWLVLVVTLQRGPVTPCDNELSPITDPVTRSASIAALLLPLLVLLPFPAAISFTNGLPDLPPTF